MEPVGNWIKWENNLQSELFAASSVDSFVMSSSSHEDTPESRFTVRKHTVFVLSLLPIIFLCHLETFIWAALRSRQQLIKAERESHSGDRPIFKIMHNRNLIMQGHTTCLIGRLHDINANLKEGCGFLASLSSHNHRDCIHITLG